LLLLAACAAALSLCGAALAGDEAGFEPLFDGETLTGWRGPDMSFWSIENGAITGTISQEHAPSMNQYLVWQREKLDDFELKLSFRMTGSQTPNTNGGFQFRSKLLPDGDVAGYQVDNNFGQKEWKARLYDEFGRHTLAFEGKRTVFDADGTSTTTDLVLEPGARDFRLDEWHEYHLVARGPLLQLKVNGKLIAEVIDNDPKQHDFSGILALQLHTGPPHKAQFKEIRLKRLK